MYYLSFNKYFFFHCHIFLNSDQVPSKIRIWSRWKENFDSATLYLWIFGNIYLLLSQICTSHRFFWTCNFYEYLQEFIVQNLLLDTYPRTVYMQILNRYEHAMYIVPDRLHENFEYVHALTGLDSVQCTLNILIPSTQTHALLGLYKQS